MDKVDMLQRFLEDLQSLKHMDDWQVQQAREAVQLYMGQFLKGEGSEFGGTPSGAFDPDSVLARMREAIRIKHYSYSVSTDDAAPLWVGTAPHGVVSSAGQGY
jgi:hypothetical protein